jgi:hypothetical protein
MPHGFPPSVRKEISMMKRTGLALMLAAFAACTSTPAPSTAATPSQNVITADELSVAEVAGSNLYDALQRLRPRFFMTRGAVSSKNPTAGSTHVSVDGGPLVPIETLTRILPSQVAEVRFLSASDAAQRFGTTAASGSVILVKSR